MGYPDKALADGEHVVLHHHPHVKQLTWPVAALLLLTAAAGVGAGMINPRDWDQDTRNIAFGLVCALWALSVGWLTLRPILRWRTTHLVLTDQRLMFRHGLLRRGGVDVPLERINNVAYDQRFPDRLLRTGTLIVESGGDGVLEFYDVKAVRRVQAWLYHELFAPRPDPESESSTSR